MLVSDVIISALIHAGKVPLGGGVPASWLTHGLAELNAMLQSWAAEGLLLHTLTTSTPKTLTVGDPSYTIGASGDINNRRPVEVVAAKVALSGTDYALKVANSILDYVPYATKTTQGRPTHLFYDADYASSLATLWLYPSPDQAYALTLYSLVSLAPFATTGETIALPPEYEQALSANLGVLFLAIPRIINEGGRPDPVLLQRAKTTKATLLTNNSKRLIREANFDAALLTTSYGSGGFTIQTG